MEKKIIYFIGILFVVSALFFCVGKRVGNEEIICQKINLKFYPEIPDFATTESGILVNYTFSEDGTYYFFNGTAIYVYEPAYVFERIIQTEVCNSSQP